jgi:hypothetical protein
LNVRTIENAHPGASKTSSTSVGFTRKNKLIVLPVAYVWGSTGRCGNPAFTEYFTFIKV